MRIGMHYILVILSLIIATTAYADVSPADLVKVTTKTDPSCIEYYSYKNEMYCSTKAMSAAKIDPSLIKDEKQRIFFDERPWQAAWGKNDTNSIMIEYVPRGDNVERWTELVTSLYIADPQNKIQPKAFAEVFVQGLKDNGFSPEVTYLKDTANQVIFEFRLKAPRNQIQDELQMVTKGQDGVYILRYTIKEADMGQGRRDKWLGLLMKSSIK